jgi:hypothetical protein
MPGYLPWMRRPGRSLELYTLSKSTGIGIWPVRPGGWIDAIGWNAAFSGGKTGLVYYDINGRRADRAPSGQDKYGRGMIVFPTPVNSPVIGAGRRYGSRVRSFFRDIVADISADVHMESVIYSYGGFFKRKYYHEPTGTLFDRDCLSVEVCGAAFRTLVVIGAGLAGFFGQSHVLIREGSGGIFLAEAVNAGPGTGSPRDGDEQQGGPDEA